MTRERREYRRFARFQGLQAVATIPRAVAASNPFDAEVLTDEAVGYTTRAARWAHLAEAIDLDEQIEALSDLGDMLARA